MGDGDPAKERWIPLRGKQASGRFFMSVQLTVLDMAPEVTERVRKLARERDVGESEIIQQAVESGVETLWRDLVIEQYIDGSISKAEAIDELGRETVREVERAQSAVEEDVAWGSRSGGSQ